MLSQKSVNNYQLTLRNNPEEQKAFFRVLEEKFNDEQCTARHLPGTSKRQQIE
jgi:hypothetical protein